MNFFNVSTIPVIVLCYVLPLSAFAQEACNKEDVQKNYSLYAEDYKNKNYESALPYLKWILTCAPNFGTSTDRNFRRLVDVYEGIAMKNDDSLIRRAYMDSALMVYDTAPTDIQNAGIELDAFKWTFNKGYFIQSHADDLADIQKEVRGIYLDAYQIDPTRVEPYFINYIINDFVKQGEEEEALRFMDDVEKQGIDVADMLDTWRDKLIVSPEDRITYLEKRLEIDSEDTEVMYELLQLYNELGMRDEAVEIAETMIAQKPTAILYRMIGTMRLEDGFEDEAIGYLKKSLEFDSEPQSARAVHYQIAVAHQQAGRFAEARTHFQRALEITPDFGEALIALGHLVAAAVHECGTLDRKDKAVYWLAADYFDLAVIRASSPKLRQQARQHLNRIEPYFPSVEDKFYMHWETGDPYTIDYGCYTWIDDSTTIR